MFSKQRSVKDVIIDSRSHVVVYLNIDNIRWYFNKEKDFRLELWPECDPYVRAKMIMEMVVKYAAFGVIFVLHEVMLPILEYIRAECESHEIQCRVIPYHTDPSAMLFVYCIPKEITILGSTQHLLVKGECPLSDGKYGAYPDVDGRKKPEWRKWALGEYPRSMGEVCVKFPDGRIISVYAWHPALYDDIRIEQTAMMAKILQSNQQPWIAGGDLNCMRFNDDPEDVGKLNTAQIGLLRAVGQWETPEITSTFYSCPWDIRHKLSAEKKKIYDELLRTKSPKFREFCESVDRSGGALDQVFTSKLRADVEAIQCVESDHAVMICKLRGLI